MMSADSINAPVDDLCNEETTEGGRTSRRGRVSTGVISRERRSLRSASSNRDGKTTNDDVEQASTNNSCQSGDSTGTKTVELGIDTTKLQDNSNVIVDESGESSGASRSGRKSRRSQVTDRKLSSLSDITEQGNKGVDDLASGDFSRNIEHNSDEKLLENLVDKSSTSVRSDWTVGKRGSGVKEAGGTVQAEHGVKRDKKASNIRLTLVKSKSSRLRESRSVNDVTLPVQTSMELEQSAVSVSAKQSTPKKKVTIASAITSPSAWFQPLPADEVDPLWLKPFEIGWMRSLVKRANTGKAMGDIYYHSPDGKKLRSMREIIDYLRNTSSLLSEECFTFRKQPIYREPFEIVRDARAGSLPSSAPGTPGLSTVTPGKSTPGKTNSGKKRKFSAVSGSGEKRKHDSADLNASDQFVSPSGKKLKSRKSLGTVTIVPSGDQLSSGAILSNLQQLEEGFGHGVSHDGLAGQAMKAKQRRSKKMSAAEQKYTVGSTKGFSVGDGMTGVIRKQFGKAQRGKTTGITRLGGIKQASKVGVAAGKMGYGRGREWGALQTTLDMHITTDSSNNQAENTAEASLLDNAMEFDRRFSNIFELSSFDVVSSSMNNTTGFDSDILSSTGGSSTSELDKRDMLRAAASQALKAYMSRVLKPASSTPSVASLAATEATNVKSEADRFRLEAAQKIEATQKADFNNRTLTDKLGVQTNIEMDTSSVNDLASLEKSVKSPRGRRKMSEFSDTVSGRSPSPSTEFSVQKNSQNSSSALRKPRGRPKKCGNDGTVIESLHRSSVRQPELDISRDIDIVAAIAAGLPLDIGGRRIAARSPKSSDVTVERSQSFSPVKNSGDNIKRLPASPHKLDISKSFDEMLDEVAARRLGVVRTLMSRLLNAGDRAVVTRKLRECGLADASEAVDKKSGIKSPIRLSRLCGLDCPGRQGLPPTLYCKLCTTAFHPQCIGLTKLINRSFFLCLSCSKPANNASNEVSSMNGHHGNNVPPFDPGRGTICQSHRGWSSGTLEHGNSVEGVGGGEDSTETGVLDDRPFGMIPTKRRSLDSATTVADEKISEFSECPVSGNSESNIVSTLVELDNKVSDDSEMDREVNSDLTDQNILADANAESNTQAASSISEIPISDPNAIIIESSANTVSGAVVGLGTEKSESVDMALTINTVTSLVDSENPPSGHTGKESPVQLHSTDSRGMSTPANDAESMLEENSAAKSFEKILASNCLVSAGENKFGNVEDIVSEATSSRPVAGDLAEGTDVVSTSRKATVCKDENSDEQGTRDGERERIVLAEKSTEHEGDHRVEQLGDGESQKVKDEYETTVAIQSGEQSNEVTDFNHDLNLTAETVKLNQTQNTPALVDLATTTPVSNSADGCGRLSADLEGDVQVSLSGLNVKSDCDADTKNMDEQNKINLNAQNDNKTEDSGFQNPTPSELDDAVRSSDSEQEIDLHTGSPQLRLSISEEDLDTRAQGSPHLRLLDSEEEAGTADQGVPQLRQVETENKEVTDGQVSPHLRLSASDEDIDHESPHLSPSEPENIIDHGTQGSPHLGTSEPEKMINHGIQGSPHLRLFEPKQAVDYGTQKFSEPEKTVDLVGQVSPHLRLSESEEERDAGSPCLKLSDSEEEVDRVEEFGTGGQGSPRLRLSESEEEEREEEREEDKEEREEDKEEEEEDKEAGPQGT